MHSDELPVKQYAYLCHSDYTHGRPYV